MTLAEYAQGSTFPSGAEIVTTPGLFGTIRLTIREADGHGESDGYRCPACIEARAKDGRCQECGSRPKAGLLSDSPGFSARADCHALVAIATASPFGTARPLPRRALNPREDLCATSEP